MHTFYAHAAVDCLAHVVDGEQSNAYGRQRLHLDTRPREAFRSCRAIDRIRLADNLKLHCHSRQADGMTEGNQIGRTLRPLNRRNPCHADDISLPRRSIEDSGQGDRLHGDAPTRDCNPVRFGFFADIDHVGSATGIEVREFGHWKTMRIGEQEKKNHLQPGLS